MPTMARNPVTHPTLEVRSWGIALNTYRPIPDGFFDNATGSSHWVNGVTFTPFGCTLPAAGFAADDPCDTTPAESAANLTYPDSASCVSFMPFRLEYLLDVPRVSSGSIEEIRTWFEDKRRLNRSHLLAKEAMTGALTAGNPSLMGEADDVTTAAFDTSPVAALAAVEDGLAARMANGLGMIHVSPGTLIILNAGGGLHFDGENYRTASGHIVVADSGYSGGEPASGAGATGTVTPGESWIYGSGLVHYRLSGLVDLGEEWEMYNYRDNILRLNAEEYGVLMFEPCQVVAAKYS